MAYSAEESSPIAYITDSCCVCDEEFSSDSELTSHLINHANDEVFRASLQELEKKTIPKNSNSTLTTTTTTSSATRNVSGREQPLKRTASQRSASPEVWEIISDDSDEENNKNKKSPRLSNSFRLVSTPSKPPENSKNKTPTLLTSKTPTLLTSKTPTLLTSKTPEVSKNKTPNNISSVSQTPKTLISKSPIIPADKSSGNLVANKSSENLLENGPPYKCHSCTSVFNDTKTFKEHLLLHEKPRPYACQICKKTFAYKGTLRQHLHLHIGDKSHECKTCHKKFSLKSVLRKHEELHEMQALQNKKAASQIRTRNQRRVEL